MISNGLVCLIGVLTVFVGLISLVAVCYILSLVSNLFSKNEKPKAQKMPQAAAPSAPASAEIPNKQEIVAAACVAIAEDLGCDVKNIKVTSFKKA